MGAELLVAREMISFGKQMNVELAENRRRNGRYRRIRAADAAARDAQPIAERLLPIGDRRDEKPSR
mgnify:CR=1 FL=1